jgi:hypothetical protein
MNKRFKTDAIQAKILVTIQSYYLINAGYNIEVSWAMQGSKTFTTHPSQPLFILHYETRKNQSYLYVVASKTDRHGANQPRKYFNILALVLISRGV